ncbi:hypothetical protein [Tunturibacter empetritectus]|uniref:Uncharacterized protein n=1 Tax=Tunturiibacter empetritectus TaxID=3069691 RepID=A0A7W8MRD8_9BACT|nr:hypothetical protein [Edaphobacter lichenicola]MBB5317187.1 hypothetical protein [Edaphobacter lichenicola]
MTKSKKIMSGEDEKTAAWRGSCRESNSKDRALTEEFSVVAILPDTQSFLCGRGFKPHTTFEVEEKWEKGEETSEESERTP